MLGYERICLVVQGHSVKSFLFLLCRFSSLVFLYSDSGVYVCHNYGIPHFVGLGVSFLLCRFNSLVFLYSDSGVRVSQLRYPPLCWPGCGPGGQRSCPSFHTQVN